MRRPPMEDAETDDVSWRIEFAARARTIVVAFGAALIATGFAAAAPKSPRSIESSPKYAAIVVDTTTGRVLYEANADGRRYPASLTKMMTLYVLFEDLERGRFRLDSKLVVSSNAAAQPPSKLGLRPGQSISVEDAIKALVTKSANDAAVVIGENVAGSVPAFADRMTRTARAIGMSRTVFRNPNGLPNDAQYTTARDMMKLGVALQVRFPEFYPYFKIRSFTFRGRTMGNHNRLLGSVDGVDGIKTGYINASGFNLVSSVKRDGRKIVAVVMGGKSAGSRDAHMRQLIEAYLPRASRGKGFDEELVAEVKSAPKVAGGTKLIAAIPEDLKNHPRPLPRPAFEVAEADGADPAALAADDVAMPPAPVAAPAAAPVEVAALETDEGEAQGDADITTASVAGPENAPAERVVRTVSLPLPPENVGESVEAFAAAAPTSEEADALTAMIDARIQGTAFDAVETFEAPTPTRRAPILVASAVPMAPAAPEKPARKASRPAATGWLIQIGAVESEAAAAKLLDKAKAKAGKALSGADPVTETFEKGSQTYVRARFAGFDDEKAAKKACATLKKKDFACFTLRL